MTSRDTEYVEALAKTLGYIPSKRDIKRHLGWGSDRAGEAARAFRAHYPGHPAKTPLSIANIPIIEGVTANEPVDVNAIRERAAREFQARSEKESRRSMQSITFERGPICIWFSGDTHFGSPGVNVERAFYEAERIANTPGCFHWYGGDLVDNFIVGRMSAIRFNTRLSIPDEWRLGEALLSIMAPRLLAVTGGNHDAWSHLLTGVDLLERIVPSGTLYDRNEIRATVRVGEAEVRIWDRHKWMGSSIYNPTHGMERAAKLDDAGADIYVGHHTHYAGLSREFIVNRRRALAVLTGSVKEHDDYVAQQGFHRGDTSTGVGVIIWPDGKLFPVSDVDVVTEVMQSLLGV